ncbi:hypothetical protein B0H14DRAFT_2579687 [Mycena olivaceomarginata]|nr:hypothetical protein B0H14DRAFT_2579687 [Mycena olivaceomarginata]
MDGGRWARRPGEAQESALCAIHLEMHDKDSPHKRSQVRYRSFHPSRPARCTESQAAPSTARRLPAQSPTEGASTRQKRAAREHALRRRRRQAKGAASSDIHAQPGLPGRGYPHPHPQLNPLSRHADLAHGGRERDGGTAVCEGRKESIAGPADRDKYITRPLRHGVQARARGCGGSAGYEQGQDSPPGNATRAHEELASSHNVSAPPAPRLVLHPNYPSYPQYPSPVLETHPPAPRTRSLVIHYAQ